MVALQLVRRFAVAGDDRGHFGLVETTLADRRLSLPAELGSPELPGTQGLLVICHALAAQGYEPIRVTLVDSTFTAIEGQDAEQIEADLLTLFRASQEELLEYIWNDMSLVYVLQVTLRDPLEQGATVTLTQDGLITTNAVNEPKRLSAALAKVG